METKLDQIKYKTLRLMILYEEVELINQQIKPQDCGHLKTAVSVLKNQIKNLKEEIYSIKEKSE